MLKMSYSLLARKGKNQMTSSRYRTLITSTGKTLKYQSQRTIVIRWWKRSLKISHPMPIMRCSYGRLSQRVRPGLVRSTAWRFLLQVIFAWFCLFLDFAYRIYWCRRVCFSNTLTAGSFSISRFFTGVNNFEMRLLAIDSNLTLTLC